MFQPTNTQLNTLKTASNFAHSVWQANTTDMTEFISAYPLEDTITDDTIQAICANWISLDSLEAVKSGLRKLRKRMMCRWIWQDALGLASVEQLTRELSVFADCCISIAKDAGYAELVKKYGEPRNKASKPQELIVVAMGKLGAMELNLSSDIDLVFVYDDDGYTAAGEGQKELDSKRFMVRWGQHIIRLLDDVTGDGFVFRVDMRLRPWGYGSDMASNLNALKIYFAKHGREWERFAWLKARAVTGDNETQEKLNELIKSFVYRYYVDYTAFSALREMKNLIMTQVKQRNDGDNVKLGAGGIRDIEFIVQAYQLIQGGKCTELQVKHCLTALQRIQQNDFITQDVATKLHDAYVFLRRVEHAIQALNDEQTQRLPHSDEDRTRIANVLGFADSSAFYAALNVHRHTVTEQFNELVADRQQPDDENSLSQADSICADKLSDDDETALNAFLVSNPVKRLSAKSRQRLDDVWQDIRLAVAHSDNPSVAITRVLPFLERILTRSIYLVLLKENPNGTQHLVSLMTASPWLARELTQYPVLLDEFLLNRNKPLPTRDELADMLRQQMLRVEPDDEEGQLAAIRLFKKSQVLHVAAMDLLADKALMKVSDSLTWIAEVVLEASVNIIYSRLTRQYGHPKLLNGERASDVNMGFGIVGYGKLGGIELGYSSDLDLVFIHGLSEAAETDAGEGQKAISGLRFVMRLAQKLMALLATQTRDGRAYEVDMRLRPSGQSGALVSSLAAFEKYQHNNAWLWEHQALVRARPICGDATVLSEFTRIRHETLCTERETSATKAEIIKMRKKMRDHLGTPAEDVKKGLFQLKHDAGGIVDIEFMAQYGILVSSHRFPELTTWSDNVRIFEQLGQCDDPDVPCSETEAKKLTDAYLNLRAAAHHQALAEKPNIVDVTAWQATREEIRSTWQSMVVE